MSAFIALLSADLKGLVVDLRINTGGMDAYAAAVAGCFYPDTTHYEYQSFYNPTSASFQRSDKILDHLSFQTVSFFKPTQYPAGSIFIEPQGLTFSGPVVVMVSPRNVSSGEGIAMALSKLPQCKVVSFYGSHGSFGITASPRELLSTQDSIEISYPAGRSLDIHNNIQVDSDSEMIGGVIPDFRPPLNDQTIDQLYQQGIDVELNYAVQELDKMVSAAGVDHKTNQIPTTYVLEQNYPNPFNPSTVISYRLPVISNVTLKVFDILGNEVATLVNETREAGNYEVTFHAFSLASGIYFYRLQTIPTNGGQVGLFTAVKKFVLLK